MPEPDTDTTEDDDAGTLACHPQTGLQDEQLPDSGCWRCRHLTTTGIATRHVVTVPAGQSLTRHYEVWGHLENANACLPRRTYAVTNQCFASSNRANPKANSFDWRASVTVSDPE
ncbi:MULTISPECIES: hypothetical protein [Halomicrobium]|uniref:Uncharacterized protein n=2 Tax=Halomicrobium mukohataei TaxID=57705 RepID=C7NZA0_HALMD|nr:MULTISPECIES: hypothetical protein [Halomicrobium]ACV46786.1 hypothetical protein Hmuk_0654 [Halomicrobium mukohataei DSM 12286]QCD65292.1 hypothetical protein E5139_06425 [Halomicrobium mukohataei]QFR20098.1 hypothetical protein GBQ70_06420 [Halomicrobium sp. ZPS1]